eukprot:7559084-Alexandrium_andersonii.AAC.1
MNDRRERWIESLQAHGLGDQVGIRFLACSDPARASIIEAVEGESFPPPDRLSRYLDHIISDVR